MKVIVIEPRRADNNIKSHTLLNCEDVAGIYTLADTALLTHGKPMFIPDYGGRCVAECCAALRISRLGKSIPERFAARYYDAVGVGIRFELEQLREELARECRPWDIAVSFDGAATLGDFVTTDALPTDGAGITLTVDGNELAAEALASIRPTFDAAVALASRFYMIRQGDILLIPLNAPKFEAHIDTHYVGSIGGKKLLEFNVK